MNVSIDNYRGYFQEYGSQEGYEMSVLDNKLVITKDGVKVSNEEFKDIVEELNEMVLEERLADEFRMFVESEGTYAPTEKGLVAFFKSLLKHIKDYMSHKSTIDTFFKDIEGGKFAQKRFKYLKGKKDKYSIYDDFSTDEVTSIINIITSKFATTIDMQDIKDVDPNKVIENIRSIFVKSMFKELNSETNKYEDIDIEDAKALYQRMTNGDLTLPTGVKRTKQWKELFSIYHNWYSKKDESGNTIYRGWAELAKKELKGFGYSIKGDLVQSAEEESLGSGEKDHSKAAIENDRKDTLSQKVKNFLSRIVKYTPDGRPSMSFLGTTEFMPFSEMYQDVAHILTNTTDWNSMMSELERNAAQKPAIGYVYRQLKEKMERGNLEDQKFIASFYSNMEMTYVDFIGGTQEVVYDESGMPTVSIKYFNSNQNKVGRMLSRRWSASAHRPDGLGLFQLNGINFMVNQNKVALLEREHSIIKEIRTDNSIIEDRHIDALSSFMNTIGADIRQVDLKKLLDEGLIIDNNLLKGGELYKYIYSGQSIHSNNNRGIGVLIESLRNNKDPYKEESGIIERFIRIGEQFEIESQGSFINSANKSVYPVNMHTTMSRIFNAFKKYRSSLSDSYWNKFVEQYKGDKALFPQGQTESVYDDLFLSSIMATHPKGAHNNFFTKIFNFEDFDGFKMKGEVDHTFDYSSLTPVTTLLNRLNLFINNSSKDTMKIATPTMADRNRGVFVSLPRISTQKGLHQYSKKSIDNILKGMIYQDLMRISQVSEEIKISSRNKTQLLFTPDSKGNYRGLEFHQFPFLNKSDNPAVKKLLAYAKSSKEDKSVLAEEDIEMLLDKALPVVKEWIDSQVESLKERLDEYGIESNKNKKKAQLDYSALAKLYTKSGSVSEFRENPDAFYRDFIIANHVSKMSFIKMLTGDLSLYKNYENYSKRFGGLGTPGQESFQSDFIPGIEYGDKPTYNMAVIKDIYKTDTVNLDFLASVFGEKPVKAYRKGSNKTDAMGFTTLDKHMRKMQAHDMWTDEHDKAYKNYNSRDSKTGDITGQFEFVNEEGAIVRPPLTPIKTYHDGMYLKNGKMVRILVKHSTMPLLMEFTKNYPHFNQLRKAMLKMNIDEVNMDSGVKVGAEHITELKYDENGLISNLDDLHSMELETRFQRVPQTIPSKARDSKLGSQLMKLIVANLRKNYSNYEFNVGGNIVKGDEMIEKYHDVLEAMIENGREKLFKEIGYDKFLASNQDKESTKKFLQNLRNILEKSGEERDLPDNYLDALAIVDSIVEDVERSNFKVPLAFPTIQNKFEQIILSLVKNNVMSQTINGESLVQIAELGGHKTSKELKFIHGSKETVDISEIQSTKQILPKKKKVDLKDGVSEVFDENSELSDIGTKEEYSEYLDKVFPNSKYSSIVYRGSKTQKLNKDINYFTKDKTYASDRGNPKAYILNVQNPLNLEKYNKALGSDTFQIGEVHIKDEYEVQGELLYSKDEKLGDEFYNEFDNSDAIIGKEAGFKNVESLAVKNSSSTLELGSKKDIESFKRWKAKKDTQSKNLEQFKKEEKEIKVGDIVVKDGEYHHVTKLKGDKATIVKIEAAEVDIPYKLAERLKLPRHPVTGEFIVDPESFPEELRNIVGYRIPTQGKSSMLPLRIRKILTPSQGKAIIVPGEITTQMGSDFDIDKLFLMMPNYDIKWKTKNGDVFDEKGSFVSQMKKRGFDISRKDTSKLMEDEDYVQDMTIISDSGVADIGDLIEARKKTLSFLNKKFKELKPKLVAEKVSYDLENLHGAERESLENAFLDIALGILTNPVVGKELITSVDSQTFPQLVEIMAPKLKDYISELDPANWSTEIDLEIRNKMGKIGIGIYAVALNGQAIRQHSKQPVLLNEQYSVKFDGKNIQNVSEEYDELGNPITEHFNKHLNMSVDNANEPMMEVLNDNAFTSPVTSLIISSGISNNGLQVKGKDELTGDPGEIAAYFRNQPIIREFTNYYINENGNPSQIRTLANKFLKEKGYNNIKIEGLNGTVNISTKELQDNIGLDVKDALSQEEVINNFILYHDAGRMMNNLNKILNADRVKFSNVAQLEEFFAILKEVEDLESDDNPNGRNRFFTGFEGLIRGDDFRLSKAFRGGLETAKELSDLFFPFQKSGINKAKELMREGLNKRRFTAEDYKVINKHSLLYMFSQRHVVSPISPLFSTASINYLMKGDNSIDRQLISIKTQIEDSEEGDALFSLKGNAFLNRLFPHPDNFKKKEITENGRGEEVPFSEVKSLMFEFGYDNDVKEINNITHSFKKLYEHPLPEVRDLAKNLVYYQVLSKGFDSGPNSYADLIPIEVWSDRQLSLQPGKEESMIEFFNNNYTVFENGKFFKGFFEGFVKNNTQARNLIPKMKKIDQKHIQGEAFTATDSNRQLFDKDMGFVDYFITFDKSVKQNVLFKKESGDKGDRATYNVIEREGIPFKLMAYNINQKSDFADIYPDALTVAKINDLHGRKNCK